MSEEVEVEDFEDNSQGAIGYLDIDDFKSINDNHGHAIGDKVIEQIIELGKEFETDEIDFKRKNDAGDEFLFIFRGTDKQKAEKTLQSFRSRVEDLEPEGITVTVSLGLASFPKDGDSAEEIIQNADEAMYHSKDFGGNQLSVYGETEDTEEVKFTFNGFLDIEEGTTITIKSWRNSNAPSLTNLDAEEVYDETDETKYQSDTKGTHMSVDRIDDKPLTGVLSDMIKKQPGKTEFKAKIKKSRLEELPQDKDYYKSALIG